MGSEKFALSVIVPIHNGDRFLIDALGSISLNGDERVQIIVVDDASTDKTQDLVSELKERQSNLCYLRLEQNIGPGPARNLGLERAQGRYIGFLDADDYYAPQALSYLVSQLILKPEIDIVMGRIQPIRSLDDSNRLGSFSPFGTSVRCFQLGSILVRAEVLKKVGVFDAAYRWGEDIDWFFRAQEVRINFQLVEQVVLLHRRHDQNISDKPDKVVDLAMVMRASLKRRRQISSSQAIAIEDIYYVKPDSIQVHSEDSPERSH